MQHNDHPILVGDTTGHASRPARRRPHRGEHGFTLVELLIVIVILGILSAVVVFSVGGITDRGRSSACRASRTAVITAQEARYAQEGAYATDLTALAPTYINASGITLTASSFSGGSGTSQWSVTYAGGSGTALGTFSACPA